MRMKSFVYSSLRSMAHLACRFCRDSEAVHVVDPLLDLHYRFEDLGRLKRMLRARRLQINAESVATNYRKWWDVYVKWRDSSVQSPKGVISRSRELRQCLLDESDGILNALRLPNDLSAFTPVANADSSSTEVNNETNDKHMSLLLKAGMIKVESSTSNVHLVGLPAVLQYSLQKLFSEELAENTLNVSPPHLVRGAILDGLNMPKEWFQRIVPDEDSKSVLYLTGHSLSSLVAPFVKTCLMTKTNIWPVRLHSSGASYYDLSNMPPSTLSLNNISQRTKTVMLSFCKTEKEEYAEVNRLIKLLQSIFENKLFLKVVRSSVYAHNLFNFESSATTFSTSAGIEIARLSTSGSYIARRLNILIDSKSEAVEFVSMAFVEIDLTRIIAAIIEEHMTDENSFPEKIRQLLVGL